MMQHGGESENTSAERFSFYDSHETLNDKPHGRRMHGPLRSDRWIQGGALIFAAVSESKLEMLIQGANLSIQALAYYMGNFLFPLRQAESIFRTLFVYDGHTACILWWSNSNGVGAHFPQTTIASEGGLLQHKENEYVDQTLRHMTICIEHLSSRPKLPRPVGFVTRQWRNGMHLKDEVLLSLCF